MVMTHALVSVLGWGSGGVTGVDGQRIGKLNKRGKYDDVKCVCGSAQGSGCMVDGGSTTAAI